MPNMNGKRNVAQVQYLFPSLRGKKNRNEKNAYRITKKIPMRLDIMKSLGM